MRRLDRRQRLILGGVLVVLALVGGFLVFSPTQTVPSDVIRAISEGLSSLGLRRGAVAPVVEFGLNVALFAVPICIAALLWRRVAWWRWVLLGFAVSGCIETVQAVFLAGRTAQVRDLVSNTLGAALGVAVAKLLVARRVSPREPAAREVVRR